MAPPSIFGVFAQSPIAPLQQHMHKAYSCAKALLTFVDAVLADNWHLAADVQQQVSALEREADDLKRDIRLKLPKGLFLPVPRTDILELLVVQDRVANRAKDIAGLMLGRRMTVPASMTKQFHDFVQSCVAAAAQAEQAISELDDLLETGFKGRAVKVVAEMIHELNRIEQHTDQQQVTIRQALFQIEKDMGPIDVMFLYKIIDWIGDLADRAQQVGSRLQLLLAR